LLGLARFLGLDVWGNSLLNRRAAREMGSAAFLLLVVLIFELLAWSLLFNVLVHSAQWQISLKTLIAVLLASVFASGVFIFEKTFITADFGEAPIRKWLAISIRLLIIFGSALATAQPIELLVFGGAIDTRLHEETVLAEAVRQVEDYKTLESKAQSKTEGQIQAGVTDTVQFKQFNSAQEERNATKLSLAQAQQRLPGARAAAQTAAGRVQNARSALTVAEAKLRRAATEEERQDAQKDVNVAAARLDRARESKASADANLASLEEEIGSTTTRLGVAEDQVKATQTDWQNLVNRNRNEDAAKARVSEASLEKLKEWIKIAQSAAPGQPITNPNTGRILHPKPADFTDRLRILDDLRHGNPALWPPSSIEVRADAIKLFGLEDPNRPDPVAMKRRQEDSTLFGRVYMIAFIMACVIPLLTIAFKSMFAGELRDYYSTRAQARAGNPAAIEVIRARGLRLMELYVDDQENTGGRLEEAPQRRLREYSGT
jgi:hypothetical protein